MNAVTAKQMTDETALQIARDQERYFHKDDIQLIRLILTPDVIRQAASRVEADVADMQAAAGEEPCQYAAGDGWVDFPYGLDTCVRERLFEHVVQVLDLRDD